MGYLKKTIGLRFLCIREVVFGLCDVKYRKGKIYKSEIEGMHNKLRREYMS